VEPKPPLYLRPEPLPREGKMGEDKVGINVFDLDARTRALTHIQSVSGLRNPTYLACHPTLPLPYAAERETTTGLEPIINAAGASSRMGGPHAHGSGSTIAGSPAVYVNEARLHQGVLVLNPMALDECELQPLIERLRAVL
jgi:6-phosphogluconolactonase (cycloisomerase 2 family)